jgi:hypothetical protein
MEITNMLEQLNKKEQFLKEKEDNIYEYQFNISKALSEKDELENLLKIQRKI